MDKLILHEARKLTRRPADTFHYAAVPATPAVQSHHSIFIDNTTMTVRVGLNICMYIL